jgi:multiple sugar transport system permease protein
MIFALLLLWALVCLFPLYWLVITSFKGAEAIQSGPVYLPFADFTPTLDSWNYILGENLGTLLARYFNSIVVAASATVLTVTFGSLGVYALTRYRWEWPFRARTADAFFLTFLLTRVIPPASTALPLYMMGRATGLLDTLPLLVLVYTAANLPVAFWLLRAVFGPRASDQEEAALLDGASHARILLSIVVPLTASGMIAVGFFIFILSWNEYYLAAQLAGDNAMTLPPWLISQMSYKESQTGADTQEWADFSVLAILMILPALACSGLVIRLLTRISVWKY